MISDTYPRHYQVGSLLLKLSAWITFSAEGNSSGEILQSKVNCSLFAHSVQLHRASVDYQTRIIRELYLKLLDQCKISSLMYSLKLVWLCTNVSDVSLIVIFWKKAYMDLLHLINLNTVKAFQSFVRKETRLINSNTLWAYASKIEWKLLLKCPCYNLMVWKIVIYIVFSHF